MRENNLFNGIGMMHFLIGHISEQRKLDLKASKGITDINGFEGLSDIGIPHRYRVIEVFYEYFVCYLHGNITLYDNAGKHLFDCVKFNYLKEGMFLVGKNISKPVDEDKEKIAYSLHNCTEFLTNYIFDSGRMGCYFNKEGFCVLRLKDKWNDVVINKQGSVLLESDSGVSHFYLSGVICKKNDTYINLLTQTVICKRYSDQPLETSEYLFVKTDKNCIYQISKITGEFIMHGNPPKEEPKKTVLAIPTSIIKQPKPILQRRNDLCACKSGKKYKHCCINRI